MNFLDRYGEVVAGLDRERICLGQCRDEWGLFLEFAYGYFANRGIGHPVVVEIGTLENAQRLFYRELLGAEHISIDLNINRKGPADIIADSMSPEAMERLAVRLAGRPIDLLFLDGNHTYDYVKFEYRNYGVRCRHLIAFHDVFGTDADGVEVYRFWRELEQSYPEYPMLTFWKARSRERTGVWDGHEMGIGLVVKGGRL